MALVDSKASFEQRCAEVGAGDIHANLKAEGIETFAQLAYACGTPKEPPSQPAFDTFSAKVLGGNPKLGDVGMLKRLMFEASTFVVAALRQSVMGDAETPRKLPLAEKAARSAAQKQRLNGLVIERDMVPSYALVDLCSHMCDTNTVSWIGPGKCTSRESEIQVSSKETNRVFKLEDHQLNIGSEPTELAADYSSAIMLQWCLQRRGLALDQVGLLKWEQHEHWVQYLLHSLTRDCPPGWSRPGIAQLVQADKEAFMVMSSELTSIKTTSTGTHPMGEKLEALRYDPRITCILTPVPFKHPGGVSATPPAPTDDGPALSKGAKRRLRQAKAKASAKVKIQNPGGGANTTRRTMPVELKDLHQKMPDGALICWDFNLGCGCTEQTSGQPPKCAHGVHACAYCRRVGHSYQVCRARSWKGGGKGGGAKA